VLEEKTSWWAEAKCNVIYQTIWDDQLEWQGAQDGALVITGSGAMPDYTAAGVGGFSFHFDGSDIYVRLPPWKDDQYLIRTITIGKGITHVGSYAFCSEDFTSSLYDLSGLKTVTLSDTVTSIGEYAFSDCKGLKNIRLSQKLQRIDYGAFSGCAGLTEIILPDSVKALGERVFLDCDSLKEITIGSGLRQYGEGAFDASTLQAVRVSDGNPEFKSKDGVLLSRGGERLDLYPKGKKDSSYTVPAGVKTIGSEAFAYNEYLKTLVLSSDVRTLERHAIRDGKGLSGLYLNNGLKTIQEDAILSCPELTELVFPYGVTSLCDLSGCDRIRKVTIPETVTNFITGSGVDEGGWEWTSYFGFMIYDGGDPVYPLIRCVKNSAADKWAVLFGYPVEYINSVEISEPPITKNGLIYRLNGKEKTAAVTGAENAEEKTVVIPDHVKVDGKKYSVVEIAAGAFKGMKKLKSATVGKNVETIGKNAFNGCKKLKAVIIRTTRLTEKTVGDGAFKGIQKKATVACPKGMAKTYRRILEKKGAPKTVTIK